MFAHINEAIHKTFLKTYSKSQQMKKICVELNNVGFYDVHLFVASEDSVIVILNSIYLSPHLYETLQNEYPNVTFKFMKNPKYFCGQKKNM
jgi:hypothetical protein